MSEDNGLIAENELTEDQMEELQGGKAPVGKPGSFPPGNPAHIPGEQDLRKQEIEQHGREEAARRAWRRASERRSKTAPKSSKAPRAATGFSDMAGGPSIPKAPKDKPRDIKGIANTVQFAHAMLAMKLENQDWAISEDEAYMLTKAVDDLLIYYGVKFSGKASAWSALIYAVTMIYGPRVATLVMSKMKDKAA